jgi:hypothetical protein
VTTEVALEVPPHAVDVRAAVPGVVELEHERGSIPPLGFGSARSSGPAAAVLLAAGLASLTLGLLSVLSAVSASVSDALTLSDRVGELSGLTTASVIVFFGAWAVLGSHGVVRTRHSSG